MPTFNFVFSVAKKTKDAKRTNSTDLKTVESDCEGIVKCDNEGNYFVNYNGKDYSITSASYDCQNKKQVYLKHVDKYGHRIKIIRDADSRNNMCDAYVPFAPGLVAKGRLVQTSFGNVKFHIRSVANRGEHDDVKNAFREWKEYIINIEELDETNGL